MNKKLAFLVVLLLPVTIISFFFKKETNFNLEEQNKENKQNVAEKTVTVNLDQYNETLDLEDYVIGVVAGEMPALFEEEALKAQAIASRTYAINYLKSNSSISGTINNQVYATQEEMKNKWKENYDKYYNKIKNAVEATKGQIMYYNNEPIKAYSYSMSNGYTESSLNVFNEQNDYLNIIESPFDKDNSYEQVFQKEVFCQKLDISCEFIELTNIKKDKSNRIETISINNKNFTGIEVRQKLSLRSTDFTIIEDNNIVKITTKGYGHGVGMSQHGANNMAKQGYKYEEILKYYYQNIEIDEL